MKLSGAGKMKSEKVRAHAPASGGL
jgi:hypothetical protein